MLPLVFLVLAISVGAVDFKYRDYAEITKFFKKLQRDHGEIVEVFDALKKWPDIAPNKTDLPQCGNSPCEWLVVHITNLTSYKQNPLTPEMYISGCLHGDEIIGPNIVTEYAGFLAAEYETNPDITHMLNTRSLWITPMTNAAGYHAIKREESNAKGESYDPNRDFPYNDYYQDGGKSCMKTIAARVVAELYKHQMIQISITMHSGISSLTYLWGSPNHAKKLPNCTNSKHNACVTTPGCCASTDAPDVKAFRAIGQSIYRAFGSMSGSCALFKPTWRKPYPPRPHRDQSGKCWYFGKAKPSTDAVYAVNGGMEDFSYAYSWEGKLQHVGKNPIPDKCGSRLYGGYNMEVKKWNQSVKQVNYLIEASDKKEEKLGYGNPDELSRSSDNDGHVARHIRAFLRLLELLHPEIKVDTKNNNFYGIGCHTIEARVVKWARAASDGACTTVPENTENHHKYNSPSQCRGLRLWQNIDEKEASKATSGLFDLSKLDLDSGNWCYAIVASFDAEWANQDDTAPDPKVPPQSHLVNARTQPNYQVPNASGKGPRINATKDHFIPLTHINDAEIKKKEKKDSDSNNAALLPVKTQVDSPLVFCGLSKGYKINAATCADCQPCEGDCHMVGDVCVDGESACRGWCLDCGYASESCLTYLSFRDGEICERCDFDPSSCKFKSMKVCGDFRFCTVKNDICVAGECIDEEQKHICLEQKEKGDCTSVENLRALPNHPCKKTCGLCHTIGMDKECKFDSGSNYPHLCAPTTTCVTKGTHEKCKQSESCICVKDKDVNKDCGYTSGAPYKCIRSSVCLVTATNEECGNNENENVCSCVERRDNGEDCGNPNGPPYPCIREDLCVVTNNISVSCSENASEGTCSCFRPTCSSTRHKCQDSSSRNNAADNYSCDAKSLECTDDICCTPVYDFLGSGKCERVDGAKLEDKVTDRNLGKCDKQCTMEPECGGYATSSTNCRLYISAHENMSLSKEQTDSLKCFVKAVECRQRVRNADCENCSRLHGKSCAASDGLGICKAGKCATATASQCTSDGRKIAKQWICDGVKDCADGSDEGDCDPCKCSGETTKSFDGITQGGKDCESQDQGRGWCYVNISAACADKVPSGKNVTQGWSFLACSVKAAEEKTTTEALPGSTEEPEDKEMKKKKRPAYNDLGEGKCALQDGSEVKLVLGDWNADQGRNCAILCNAKHECGGYSVSNGHCLLYSALRANLKLSDETWGSSRCMVKADSSADSEYHTVQTGLLGEFNYTLNFYDSKDNHISPWHDIPHKNVDDFYNFVCEIPKGTTEKMEIVNAMQKEKNPIKQDTKVNKTTGEPYVRYVTFRGGIVANYGFLAQTWENPNVTHDDHFGELGKNVQGDGDPVDVLVLGNEPCKRGDVFPVKLVGGLALLDSGERDWKLVAVRVCNGKADDKPANYTQQMNVFRNWYVNYKGAINGHPVNKIQVEIDAVTAEKVALDTYNQWADEFSAAALKAAEEEKKAAVHKEMMKKNKAALKAEKEKKISTEECSGHMVSDLSKTTHPTKCKQEVEGLDKKVAIHFGYDMTAKSINLCIVNTANANWVALGASKEDAKEGEGASFMKDNVISIYAEEMPSTVYTLAIGSLGTEKTDASGISDPYEKKTGASRTLCFKLAEANLKKADGQSSVNLAKASFIWAIGTSEVPTVIHSHKGVIQLNVMGSMLEKTTTEALPGSTEEPEEEVTTTVAPASLTTTDVEPTTTTISTPVCAKAGLARHHKYCNKFYFCAHRVGGYRAYEMDCGSGTAFNEKNGVCDWPSKVDGCTNGEPVRSDVSNDASESRSVSHTNDNSTIITATTIACIVAVVAIAGCVAACFYQRKKPSMQRPQE